MAGWRDYAARKEDEPDGHANSAISAKSPPNGANGTNGTASLPAHLIAGLDRLCGRPVPRGLCAEAWQESRENALALASQGWAGKALALGWSHLDLFGGAVSGCHTADGLAVWLAGRELVALAESFAVAVDRHGNRHFFNRPRAPGARLLWTLGGGR